MSRKVKIWIIGIAIVIIAILVAAYYTIPLFVHLDGFAS